MTSMNLRIRLLEPSNGVVTGGSRLLIHGKGFRPAPHSLIVRFRLLAPEIPSTPVSTSSSPAAALPTATSASRVDIPGKFIMESQMECVLPSFQDEAKQLISRATKHAATSSAVLCSPQLLHVQIEVILDSESISNALLFVMHQQIVIQKITPQYVLMAPPTTMTVALNLLRLSSQSSMDPRWKDSDTELPQEISSLPVYVRVRQVSERTGAVSEQTREAAWKVSAIGVYEVEFGAIMMGFGVATVELTLNRCDFFRGKEKAQESLGYHVYRDMTLEAVEPCCISVTSGRMTEVRVLGEGFVDSGDLVVALSQREINSEDDGAMVPVAQLNATFCNRNEIRCSVQPNMSFGLTAFHVSLNGGRQFGRAQVVALLHRDRALKSISPDFGSLEGNTFITIRHACLTVEDMDSPKQLQKLVPPKKIRIRFQAVNEDGTPSERLVKVINAESIPSSPSGLPEEERGVIRCRAPSFLEEMKAKNGAPAEKIKSDREGDVVLRIKRFRVSIALGNDSFFGTLDFGYYFPPVIRSITMHHGPITGGTSVCLRMKYKVPPRLPILVRFQSLSQGVYETVSGEVQERNHEMKSSGGDTVPADQVLGSPLQSPGDPENHPAFLIFCKTPPWTKTVQDLPHLTKVQVSYNGRIEFVPMDDPVIGLKSPRALMSPRAEHTTLCLVKDLSHLYFLFYRPPKLHAVFPMSADIHGGSYLRILGEFVADHGAQVTVVFQSPQMSRKVIGFVENGEIRCCAPPFNVGLAAIFVSLNSEQYTKCEFFDPETKTPIEFVFYSSPSLNAISPLCACISMSSVISVYGVNLIETGRIKVRFGFATHHGKQVFKDVHGKARNGVITAPSPLFSSDFTDKHATVDVALNGYDFSGTTASLYYFSSYAIKRVEPATGAFEIPIDVALFVTPQISSDAVQIKVRFKCKYAQEEKVFGPVDVKQWTANRVDFVLPAIASYVDTLEALESAFIDLSFDKTLFHNVGELLQHYKVYSIPHVVSMSPLYGLHEKETDVVARGFNLRESDVVRISLYLEDGITNPAAVVVGRVNQKRQLLTWKCPALDTILSAAAGGVSSSRYQADSMLLKHSLKMRISIVDGQQKSLPFEFRYYKSPRLLSMNPSVGYICSGSLISFEFVEKIETPTVDFRFGARQVTGGRIRDGRFVECFSPELTKGTHDVAVSFNEQHYEFVDVEVRETAAAWEPSAEDEAGKVEKNLAERGTADGRTTRARATFQAFALPLFALPDNRDRICAFGPVTGGTTVRIKGHGFIADAKIYVRFCSPFKSGFGTETSEVVVDAKVLDSQTIQCAAPPSKKQGRVSLHVSYNLQQYTDSQCFFEYHSSTRYSSEGILCGPVSGGTPVTIAVDDSSGLPANKDMIDCVVRFTSDEKGIHKDVEATFNPEALTITSCTPAWPSNELVSMQVALMRGSSQQFVDSAIHFLFYDPPEGVITIEPSAGPVSGGTEVVAWCGKIVDTGEITVSITMCKDGESVHSRPGTARIKDSAPEAANELDRNTTLPVTMLVKGKIVGEAVTFITPTVAQACVAYLNISLNGINYTSMQTKSMLRFIYYVEPIIRRISPAWSPIESVSQILISGEHIKNYGCQALVRFQLQNADDRVVVTSKVVDGRFPEATDGGGDEGSCATNLGALECCAESIQSGCYEIEISLNGQQFSKSNYMNAKYGNYGGTACTALLPFRCFSTPFFLATPTGPAAGGSTVILYLAKKLAKMLAKESRCQVQFAPLRLTDLNSVVPLNQKGAQAAPLDPIPSIGEIDHANDKITCRAPLLRSACAATIDVILPATQETKASSTSTCAFFGVKDREKYYSYESPTIVDIVPTCGPTSGGTCLVIEGTNVLDTGQLFVRFRSSLNEREFVLIPGTYSRTFPDGSLSCSPLIICKTPAVEIVDKVLTVESLNGSNAPSTASHGASNTPRHKDALAGRTRMQTFQQLAEQSVRLHQRSPGANGSGPRVLKITRTVIKNAAKGTTADATSNVNVLVDFTLNAGEQFIAHSVTFHYYVEMDPSEVTWFPRHLPTRSLDRQPLGTRMITVQLPKSFRLNDMPERISFHFDGLPQPIYWKRRGSSVVLHETGVARELLVLDAAKLKKQSTMSRRSTYFRNSSISASSNNLLSNSGGNVLPSNVRARPAPLSRPSEDSTSPSKPASSQSISPYIAGKVVRFSELTCPIPDFSCVGAIKVYLSLNAQQFICLGELNLHDPVGIKEDDKYRFCSNIGGDPFMLHCSSSTIFNFLSSQCVTNEEHHNEHMLDVAAVKASKALVWRAGDPNCADELTVSRLEESEGEPKQMVPQRSQRGSHLPSSAASTVWRDREFHVVHVHMIPPLLRALKKTVVSVSRVDSQVEIGTSVPDDNGCCVFEMTDWASEMLLKASPPPNSGYSAYSAIILEEISYRRRTKASKVSDTSGEISCASHILMLHHPPEPALKVVVFCPWIERATVVLLSAEGVAVEGEAVSDEEGTPADDPRVRSLIIDPDKLALHQKFFYVCIEFQGQRDLASQCVEERQNAAIQVAISDHTGVRIFLRGMAVATGVWMVANVSVQSGDVIVTSIDCLLSSMEEFGASVSSISTPETEGHPAKASQESGIISELPQKRSITAAICFSCADSSRMLSCSSEARLVLPGSSDLASFMSGPLHSQEVRLECAMPELSFSGPTVLLVTFDGITFSNSICIQCYDPRMWRITSLDPPCGLIQKQLMLRVHGENFVENRKIVVRFSDAARYFNVPATVEKIQLLILRVAAIKNLKSLLQPLGIPSLTPAGTLSQKREDDKSHPLSTVSNFTLTLRIECGSQFVFAACREASVLAAISSGSVLSWDEQFELSIFSKQSRILLALEISDASLTRPIEIARTVASIDTLQDGVMGRKTFGFEEHFRKGHGSSIGAAASSGAVSPTGASVSRMPSEVDLLLHLSPLMLNSSVVVCTLQPLQTPQKLRVQVSSGDSFYSSCDEIRNSVVSGCSSWYHAYDLPKVTETSPKVVPRSAGGEILITGVGFIDCDDAKIIVRVFACSKHVLTGAEEHQVLGEMNTIERLERKTSEFFIRDLAGKFVSSTQVTCVIPANLAAYNLYYRLSFDGREFTEATPNAHVLMFSIDSITPRGGPVSGNTYTALHGTNIHACLSRWDLVSTVRLKWMRGSRELESVVVPGEFYHSEDTIYFYSPQSRFGLQNITVNVELCLCTRREVEGAAAASCGSTGTNSVPGGTLRFGQDEIPFVMYKAPSIKVIAPTLGLVCGISSLEMMVQGLDDKAALSLRHAHKMRFKRRGQMQVSSAQLVGEGKFTCFVPRFNVSNAVATPLREAGMTQAIAMPSPSKHGAGGGNSIGSSMKIWNRDAGIYVSVLRARNLQVAKKHTCNPFAVISCNSARLKSTRKEGAMSPVWNELFDFEWKTPTTAPVIRVAIENQLTMDQSEIVGNVDIRFSPAGEFNRAFSLRAWFPLRKKSGKTASSNDGSDLLHHKGHHRLQPPGNNHTSPSLGDIELAISYIPTTSQANKPRGSKLSSTSVIALKSSVMSVITNKKLQQPLEDALQKKKEKILSRLFRHQGPPVSMVPTELLVELALNGQDFWSVSPHRCYLTPTPILVNVEPSYISINGGTQMHIFGMNFTSSGSLRVAFAVANASSESSANTSHSPHAPSTMDANRVVVVDAKYRSSTCISCVTPALQSIATGNSDVVLYVSTNGMDFESIGLPHEHTSVQTNVAPEVGDRVEGGDSAASSPRKRSDKDIIVLEKDGYFVHQERLAAHQNLKPRGGGRSPAKSVVELPSPMPVLMQQVHLYLLPTIFGVKPSDGIYTSRLTVEGKDFTQSNAATGKAIE